MAYKKRPTNSVIKKKKLRAAEKRLKSNTNPSLSAIKILQVKQIQAEIDKYNESDLYRLDPFFKSFQPVRNSVIIRLKQENFIKLLDETNPNDIQLDAYIRQIDARARNTDQPKWVPTPFPYVDEGIIVAISPEVIMAYKELQDKVGSEIVIPKIGDTVYVRPNTSVWYKDHRFYIDKQEQAMDYVRNQEALNLSNFHHYFKVDDFELEGILSNTDKECFFEGEESESFIESGNKYAEAVETIKNQIIIEDKRAKDSIVTSLGEIEEILENKKEKDSDDDSVTKDDLLD